MTPRPLEAVFFDVGGTLIAPRPSFPDIYSRVLVPLGIRVAAGDFQQAARETWAEFDALVGKGRDRYSHFEGGEREYWSRFVRRVLERVSQAEKADEAAEILNETFSDPEVWGVFPEVRPTLQALGERGLRLGIISNWDSRLRRILSGKIGVAGVEGDPEGCRRPYGVHETLQGVRAAGHVRTDGRHRDGLPRRI